MWYEKYTNIMIITKFQIIIISLALLFSCSINKTIEIEEYQEEPQVEQQTEKPLTGSYGPIGIVIVDEDYNDRLNPESPSYWGDEFTKGIELFTMYKGQRLLYKHLFPLLNSEDYGGSVPGFAIEEYFAKYSTITSYNAFNKYYVIFCGDGEKSLTEGGEIVVSNWICYPDESEDKVEIEWGDAHSINPYIAMIWINGELAFQRVYEDVILESLSTPEEPFIFKQAFYNPKYYPWMKPILTDNGEQIGIVAEGYGNFVVIVK